MEQNGRIRGQNRLNRLPRSTRSGFVRGILEWLLALGMIWCLIILIPFSVPVAKSAISVRDQPAAEPVRKLTVTADGRELWFQRGQYEILAVEIASGRTRSIYGRKCSPIAHWNVSQDGATYLLSSDDREVVIFRNQQLLAWEYRSDFTSLMATMSSNGKTAVRISGGTEVRCWDLSTNVPVEFDFRLPTSADAMSLDFLGNRLAIAADDGSLALFDPRTGKEVRRWQADDLHSKDPVFSEDGRLLMVATAKCISLFDAATGERIRSILSRDSDAFVHVDMAPDGKWIAASSVTTGIRIYDAADGTLKWKLPVSSLLHRVGFAPSCQVLFSGAPDGSIRSWSLAQGVETPFRSTIVDVPQTLQSEFHF